MGIDLPDPALSHAPTPESFDVATRASGSSVTMIDGAPDISETLVYEAIAHPSFVKAAQRGDDVIGAPEARVQTAQWSADEGPRLASHLTQTSQDAPAPRAEPAQAAATPRKPLTRGIMDNDPNSPLFDAPRTTKRVSISVDPDAEPRADFENDTAGFGMDDAPATVTPPEDGVAGIYGTVTGFGSIYVNGIHVETDSAATHGLSIGDVVAIAATENSGALHAASIEEIHALIGPMTMAPEFGAPHRLTVMGVTVVLAPGASIVDADTGDVIDNPYELPINANVSVSGLWQGAEVIANRIEVLHTLPEKATGEHRSHAAGEFARSDDGWRIGSLPISGELLTAVSNDIPEGKASFARVSGVFKDGALTVDNIKLGVPQALARPGVKLSIEGFLQANTSGGAPIYRIDGLGMALDASATPKSQVAGGRTILVGQSALDSSGVFRPIRGLPLPNAFDRRLEILKDVDDGFEPRFGEPLR